jgi:hypothetical protein
MVLNEDSHRIQKFLVYELRKLDRGKLVDHINMERHYLIQETMEYTLYTQQEKKHRPVNRTQKPAL